MSIRFWVALQGPVVDCLKSKIDDWNKTHVDSQVELKNTAGLLNYGQPAQVALDKSQVEQPSLVLAPEFMTGTMTAAAKERKVIPIYDILENEQLSKISTLVQRTYGDQQGRVLSLPFNPACGILYTNKEALVKAGKSADFVPRTMEELEEVCKKMMEMKVVDNGYTCAWPAAYLVEVPAAQQDIPIALPDNGFSGYGTYQLSRKWLRNHLFDIRRQIKEGIFVYSGRDNNAKTPFINKKVAFYMQGSSHAAFLQKEAAFEIGCGPIPTLEKGQQEKYAFPLGGASIWVMNNEQTRNALKGIRSFLDYLASNEVQKELHLQAASVPVSSTLPVTLQEFYKNHPLHKAVVAQTIESKLGKYSYGIRMPNYGDARKALFDLIEKVVDVNNTSDKQVDKLLKEFDGKYSISRARHSTIPGMLKTVCQAFLMFTHLKIVSPAKN